MFARPGLPGFDYVRATTPGEVVALLREGNGAARPLMGGTDLFANMRDGKLRPRVVVDVKGLPGMRDLVYAEGDGLSVGAAVTMNEIARHADVAAHYPLLAEAAASVASYQVRNRATMGGNLCNASPCADTAPVALVLDAELVLCGPGPAGGSGDFSQRVVPASAFFTGPGQTVLRPGEFMTSIRFSPPQRGAAARYLKLGRCRSGDLSLVGVAVLGWPKGRAAGNGPDPAGRGWRFRIGLGSVAPTVFRAAEAEDYLASHPPGEAAFLEAAERAMAIARPITDVRGTAAYQRAMVRILTLRGLRDVWARLGEGE